MIKCFQFSVCSKKDIFDTSVEIKQEFHFTCVFHKGWAKAEFGQKLRGNA